MTYELVKKLRDAGFPQGDSFDNVIASGVAMAYLRESKPDDVLLEKYETALNDLKAMYEDDQEWVYQPTLEELVEACGANISDFSLKNSFIGGTYGMHWYATLLTRNNGERLFQGEGSTPSEAVASLWLALHDKLK